ncbi:hypothetical protein J3R82DRAFT_6215 [Butyriboletus roseoflavus]|nr:hypothetical protein J3R82DRAFT_6215 [Butyriboletus roseoflavus]
MSTTLPCGEANWYETKLASPQAVEEVLILERPPSFETCECLCTKYRELDISIYNQVVLSQRRKSGVTCETQTHVQCLAAQLDGSLATRIPLPLPGQVLVYFVLFASFALAALQNTTVDDAVLTGAVVPQYLPNQSEWNIGNTCTGCFVQPDPSLAYNGTWHDTTYSPNNNYTQTIEFTFTGSALYIFFIIANSVRYATTLTDVQFVLDNGVATSTYTHAPGTTTNYQYNVPVYVNESLASGQHNMTILPVNTGNNVLILFDYLIYSTDTSSSASPSVPAASNSPSASATSNGTQGTSSGPNIGAIIGAVDANGGRLEEGPAVEPFYTAVEAGPISLVGRTPSIKPLESPLVELASATDPSIMTPQPSTPPASTIVFFSSGAPPSAAPSIVEQVELLRAEVARLRDLHEAPPEYSLGGTD